MAHSLEKRIERIEADAVDGAAAPARRCRCSFPEPPPPGAPCSTSTTSPSPTATSTCSTSVTFDVGRGERLLILGLNGAGKTSLLRILAGDDRAPTPARSHFGHNVSVGYYAQEHEGITAGRYAARPHAGADRRSLGDEELRRLLGMFGLTGDKAFQDAGTLSGGEKTKLALAQLVVGRHNVLLLDEPTNNLDPRLRAATAGALAGWPGTMVIVSHDTDFVARARARPRAADARRRPRLLARRPPRPGRARLAVVPRAVKACRTP